MTNRVFLARQILRTGGDELRGGNSAFIRMILMDGSMTSEFRFADGLAQNSDGRFNILFPETFNVSDIRAIRIRHDGRPRSGHPFDTYDNWDVRSIDLDLTDGAFNPIERIYTSFKDSTRNSPVLLQRFTNHFTRRDFFVQCAGNEPDFEITQMNESPSTGRLNVTITNKGCGRGQITRVECSRSRNRVTWNDRLEMAPESTGAIPITISVGLVPQGNVTCAVTGVDEDANPERITTNNRSRQGF